MQPIVTSRYRLTLSPLSVRADVNIWDDMLTTRIWFEIEKYCSSIMKLRIQERMQVKQKINRFLDKLVVEFFLLLAEYSKVAKPTENKNKLIVAQID